MSERVPYGGQDPHNRPEWGPGAARTTRHLVAVRLPAQPARPRRHPPSARHAGRGPGAPSGVAPRRSGRVARGWQPPSWRPACSSAVLPASAARPSWTSTHDGSVQPRRRCITQSGGSAVPAAADRLDREGRPERAALGGEDRRERPRRSGSGSGIILSADGKILTNNHVVAWPASAADRRRLQRRLARRRPRSSAPTR